MEAGKDERAEGDRERLNGLGGGERPEKCSTEEGCKQCEAGKSIPHMAAARELY